MIVKQPGIGFGVGPAALGLLVAGALSAGCAAARAGPGRTDADVDRMVAKLVENLKSAQIVEAGPKRGSFQGEREDVHAGGVTALATYALLAAGTSVHDPVIRAAVDYLAEHPLPGTYSRSLRAAAWAQLVQRSGDPVLKQRYRARLQEDAEWLVRALREDGFYGYDLEGTGGDHSCSQFGILGIWAAQSASASVPDAYWERVSRHWLAHQSSTGGWSYAGTPPETVTMTTAGVNTLYITLSQYYARHEPPYLLLRGVPRREDPQERHILEAAERGFDWLMRKDILAGGPYQLFGLERLGVASGRKFIGGVDWYRAGVESLEESSPNVVDDSLKLLFLVYGRAPVLAAKLEIGEEADWNEYYRDLHFAVDYLSQQHERIYKWQIVSAQAPLSDWLDAPILLVSGTAAAPWTGAQIDQLRDYVDAGGTVIGHANHGSPHFAGAFRRLCVQAFGDRDWALKPLADDHPLFRAAVGRDRPGWARPFQIEGIDDGLRTGVLLIPADVAGAWHQDRVDQHPDLFNLLSNLAAYAAGEYGALPRRLRPPELAGAAAPPRGYLTVADHSAGAGDASGRWRWLGRHLLHERGLALAALPARAGDVSLVPTPDLVHVGGRGTLAPDAWLTDGVLTYLRSGGLAWFEAVASDRAFVQSVESLFATLAGKLGGEAGPLERDHPILTGRVNGGYAIEGFRPGKWGRGVLPSSGPDVTALRVNGRIVALLTPVDLLATATGHPLFEVAAFGRPESAALLKNILVWRYAGAVGGDPAAPPTPLLGQRPWGALMDSGERLLGGQHLDAATEVVAALAALAPADEATIKLRNALHDRLTAAYEEASRAGRWAEAAHWRRAIATFSPEQAAALEPITLTDSAEQAASEPIDDAEGAAAGAASADSSVAPPDRKSEVQPLLPEELAAIEIIIAERVTHARDLLQWWFDLEAELNRSQTELEGLQTQWQALDDRARELIRRRSGRDSGAGGRGGGEFEVIAAERQVLDGKMKRAQAELDGLVKRMNEITARLQPHAERIRAAGLELRDGRWEKVE